MSPQPAVAETTVDLPVNSSPRAGSARRRPQNPRSRLRRAVALRAGASPPARSSPCRRQSVDSIDARGCGRAGEWTRAGKNSGGGARSGARIVYHSCSARRLRDRRAHAAADGAAPGGVDDDSICVCDVRAPRPTAGIRSRCRQPQRAITAGGARVFVNDRLAGLDAARHSRPSCGTRNGTHRDGWLPDVDHDGARQRGRADQGCGLTGEKIRIA